MAGFYTVMIAIHHHFVYRLLNLFCHIHPDCMYDSTITHKSSSSAFSTLLISPSFVFPRHITVLNVWQSVLQYLRPLDKQNESCFLDIEKQRHEFPSVLCLNCHSTESSFYKESVLILKGNIEFVFQNFFYY